MSSNEQGPGIAGSTHEAKGSTYEELSAELEEIIHDDEKIREFIRRRVGELESTATPIEISAFANRSYSGFIHPDSRVRRSFMVDPFHVDDAELYFDFVQTLREIMAASQDGSPIRGSIIPAIQHEIARYFGNLTASSSAEDKNREFYSEHSQDGAPNISIKDLKGKRIGVCAEKAAVAQNLASFMGMTSTFIAGGARFIPESKEEFHAFNIVQTSLGQFLFDPTNPKLATDEENKVVNYAPAFYPLTVEQVQELMKGGSVSVKHELRVLGKDGAVIREDIQERTYIGPRQ